MCVIVGGGVGGCEKEDEPFATTCTYHPTSSTTKRHLVTLEIMPGGARVQCAYRVLQNCYHSPRITRHRIICLSQCAYRHVCCVERRGMRRLLRFFSFLLS